MNEQVVSLPNREGDSDSGCIAKPGTTGVSRIVVLALKLERARDRYFAAIIPGEYSRSAARELMDSLGAFFRELMPTVTQEALSALVELCAVECAFARLTRGTPDAAEHDETTARVLDLEPNVCDADGDAAQNSGSAANNAE